MNLYNRSQDSDVFCCTDSESLKWTEYVNVYVCVLQRGNH